MIVVHCTRVFTIERNNYKVKEGVLYALELAIPLRNAQVLCQSHVIIVKELVITIEVFAQ